MSLLIHNEHTDPFFNLASEEYLMSHLNGREILMLWRNEPCVVLGRSQNAYSEVNDAFVRENKIRVVRRMTGGGAVFHDLGNLNFTCIVPSEAGQALDFARFMMPIVQVLRDLGVPAEISGRNDILVDGKKVSGNAQCVWNGAQMHHGTLLFGADISKMTGALRVDPEKIRSKGIQSVRSRVGNLSDYLPGMTAQSFALILEEKLGMGSPVSFSEDETRAIQALSDSKYSTWEWNYGVSRRYQAAKKHYFPFGLVEIGFDSERGHLTDLSIKGDFFGICPIDELCSSLIGQPLAFDALCQALGNIEDYILGARPEDIASLILPS